MHMELDWETFQREMERLARKIDYMPDIVIGIVRGGVVPAEVLSSGLGVDPMYCLNVAKCGGERQVTTHILDDIPGANVLLVEDMLETGRSMKTTKQYLEDGKSANVRTACLYTMPISEFTPDYSLREVKGPVKFPWEPSL